MSGIGEGDPENANESARAGFPFVVGSRVERDPACACGTTDMRVASDPAIASAPGIKSATSAVVPAAGTNMAYWLGRVTTSKGEAS